MRYSGIYIDTDTNNNNNNHLKRISSKIDGGADGTRHLICLWNMQILNVDCNKQLDNERNAQWKHSETKIILWTTLCTNTSVCVGIDNGNTQYANKYSQIYNVQNLK